MSDGVATSIPARADVPPPPNRPRGRLILQSTVVMLAVTACCLFAGLIAHRYPAYIDATSTRSHRLGERTLRTLKKLPGPTELIVTVNSAAIDARSAERTRDVLDALDRASDRLTVTIVDVASQAGLESLDDAWARVAERHKPEVERQRLAVERAGEALLELGGQLERTAGVLSEAESAIPEGAANIAVLRRFLADSSSFCRLAAGDIEQAVTSAREALGKTIGRSPVPSFDTAALALRRPLPTISAQLAEAARSLESAAEAKEEQVPAAVRDRLRPVVVELGWVRDRLARVEDIIRALPRPALVNVARVLERSSAAMVVGPPAGEGGRDLAAVDIDALFPANLGQGHDQPRIDLRARTEEVIGSALGSLVNPAPPIVVLLHGENARFAPEFLRFQQVFERLRLRGMDIVEWPVWLDKELPPLTGLDPRGERPVVFVTIYTVPSTPEDAARYVNLTRAVELLVEAGRPLLMSANPSAMPAIGQPDAMFEFLGEMGLDVDSGRPLLHVVQTSAGPVVTPETMVMGRADEHPISRAVSGLKVRLPWAIPLRPKQETAAAIFPVLTVADEPGTWAESQWMEFRSVPASQRPYIRPQDQPREDSQRDDGNGPWMVAAAIERKIVDREEPQRLVVVGSNGWFLDEVAETALLVDNRRVLVNPGNSELLEASVYWLAGQEDAIGTSVEAETAAVIPPLEPGTISAIRWALIGGLPVLVLLLGAVWRVARG